MLKTQMLARLMLIAAVPAGVSLASDQITVMDRRLVTS